MKLPASKSRERPPSNLCAMKYWWRRLLQIVSRRSFQTRIIPPRQPATTSAIFRAVTPLVESVEAGNKLIFPPLSLDTYSLPQVERLKEEGEKRNEFRSKEWEEEQEHQTCERRRTHGRQNSDCVLDKPSDELLPFRFLFLRAAAAVRKHDTYFMTLFHS